MTNSEQELQQLNMFLMHAACHAACSLSAPRRQRPRSDCLAQVISLIPFCTPLIMYVRISLVQRLPHGRSRSPSC